MRLRVWLAAAALCAGLSVAACAGDHCLNPQGDLPCNNVAGPAPGGSANGSGGTLSSAAGAPTSNSAGGSAQFGGASGVNVAGGAADFEEGGLGGEGPFHIGAGGESGEAGANGHSRN